MLANASPGGQALCDVVSIDVYDRLLGEEGHRDLLPSYVERIAQRARAGTVAPEPDLVASGSLALPPATYAGAYRHDAWGELTITLEGGELHGRMGDLPLVFTGAGEDGVVVHSTFGGTPASFEVEDGKVVAFVLDGDDLEMRLEKAAD